MGAFKIGYRGQDGRKVEVWAPRCKRRENVFKAEGTTSLSVQGGVVFKAGRGCRAWSTYGM